MVTLNTEGFTFSEIAGEWSVLKANFGAGYFAAASVGAPAGTRSWSMRVEVLPEDAGYPVGLIESQTRAAYLWNFYQASKSNHDEPFWIEVEDPDTGTRQNFLASFTDHRLSFAVLCAKVYATGLELRERRVLGVVSPVPA